MSKGIGQSVKYPSARLKGMQEFMEFVREPSWKPSELDIKLFKKLGMAKGREGSAIQTLRFMGIVDDDGAPTIEFDNLKKNYQPTLKRLVQEKYSDLLNLLPLSKANQLRLVSYFGDPVETAEYQAKLFVWFCEQSGIELPNVEKKFHRARFDKKKTE